MATKKPRHATKKKAPVSDLEPLAHDEYLLPGGDGWDPKEANRQKRQHYNKKMGEVAALMHRTAEGGNAEELTRYVSSLAEDERRFSNRRLARSLSLAHARDVLFFRKFEDMAKRVFTKAITPVGYAKKHSRKATDRTLTLHLSDTHIGATIDGDEMPEAYDFKAAGRRLAHVIVEAADFKRQYRDKTSLNLLLNGDMIEGLLLHDIRDGEPLAEQCVAFLRMFRDALAYLAAAFPSITVWCQPGNHGRNKLRHQGRATVQKWDSTETVLYKSLEMICAGLPNVKFQIPRAPVCVIPVFDRHVLMTHGDTHIKLASPLKKGNLFEDAANRINGTMRYGVHIDLVTVGHYHQPTVMYFRRSAAVVNGALTPPNGHAQTEDYDTACGQFLWESVPGHVLGDIRYLKVGPAQDADASFDKVIRPFSW
jgi:hypothetical protein